MTKHWPMASPWPMTSYELLNSTNTTNHLPLKTNNRLSFWKFIGLVGVSSKVASLSMYSMDFLVLHGIKRNPWNPWDPWDPWTPWSPGNPWDPWNPGTRPCPILIRGQAWYAYFRWVPCGLIFHQNRFFKTVSVFQNRFFIKLVGWPWVHAFHGSLGLHGFLDPLDGFHGSLGWIPWIPWFRWTPCFPGIPCFPWMGWWSMDGQWLARRWRMKATGWPMDGERRPMDGRRMAKRWPMNGEWNPMDG